MSRRTSILIADHQELALAGLNVLLQDVDAFDMLPPVHSSTALHSVMKTAQTDVLVIDPFTEGYFSIEDISYVKQNYPGVSVVVITSERGEQSIRNVMQVNVEGYLLKCCKKEEIINAISMAAKGDKFFCGSILNKVLDNNFKKSMAAVPLTGREVQIVQMIAEGKTTQQIAAGLCRSIHTVNTHRKNILKKLNLKNTSELIRFGIEHEIINQQA